jgi:hypothetical protein
VALAPAGCGGGSHPSTSRGPGAAGGPVGGTGPAHTTDGDAAVAVRLAGACSTAIPSQRALTGVSNRFPSTAPEPFGIASASDGQFAFVSTGQAAIQVIGRRRGWCRPRRRTGGRSRAGRRASCRGLTRCGRGTRPRSGSEEGRRYRASRVRETDHPGSSWHANCIPRDPRCQDSRRHEGRPAPLLHSTGSCQESW